MSEPWFLGLVGFVLPRGDDTIVKLAPLIEVDPEGRREPVRLGPTVVSERFPNTGHVAWFYASPEATKGSLWWFHIEESPTFEPERETHDLMRAADVRPVVEVIRPPGHMNQEEFRSGLLEEGLELSHQPTPECYLEATPEMWLGPVRLEPDARRARRWRVRADALADGLITAHAVSRTSAATSLQLDGIERLLVVPHDGGGTAQGKWDWSPPDELVKRVLRWVRKLAPSEFAMAHSAVDEFIERLAKLGLKREESLLWGHRLHRARGILEGIRQRDQATEAVIDELVRLPAVARAIEQRVAAGVAAERAGVLAAAQQEAGALLRAAEADEAKLRGEIGELVAKQKQMWQEVDDLDRLKKEDEARIQQRRAELAREQEALEENRERLRSEFEARVKELVAAPGQLLADLAILNLVAPALAGGSDVNRPSAADATSSGSVSVATRPGPGSPQPTDAQVGGLPWGMAINDRISIGDLPSMRAALRQAVRAKGLGTVPAAYLLHSTLVAGGFPLVAGDGAVDLLEAYANVAVGGRLLWLPVPAATVEPADLVGRVCADGWRAVPSGGLMDAIRTARAAPDMLAIVVLDGCTRAPLEGYLLPLLDAALPSSDGSAPERLLRSAIEPSLCPNNSDRDLLSQAWPQNLLLAGTIVPGPTTLPPGPGTWRLGTLILTDSARNAGDELVTEPLEAATAKPPLSEIHASVWHQWRQTSAGSHPGATAYRGLRRRAGSLLGPNADRLGERMATILADAADAPTGLRWLATARCGPRLGSAERIDAFDEILAALDPAIEAVPPLHEVIPWLT